MDANEKTKNDLKNNRTRIQILDFKNIVREREDNRLFICIPSKAKGELLNLLNDLGIRQDKQIDIMLIPEELLPSNE